MSRGLVLVKWWLLAIPHYIIICIFSSWGDNGLGLIPILAIFAGILLQFTGEYPIEIFKLFIELSKEIKLPLNIHSRSAGRHSLAFLLENNATQVHMHAFDGKAAAAMPGVEAGYFFSIPPHAPFSINYSCQHSITD